MGKGPKLGSAKLEEGTKTGKGWGKETPSRAGWGEHRATLQLTVSTLGGVHRKINWKPAS